jgi:dihydrofolate reductase
MRKLIESTFVTLGGDIGAPQDWGPPYLFGPEPGEYSRELLFGADALLLGRKTYQGLSAAYIAMAEGEPGPPDEFVARMNAIPKYVASTTLTELSWNATLLSGDVARQVAELKRQPGNYLLKYGTGPLDRTLVSEGLVDEFRIWIVPVTQGPGQPLFSDVPETSLELAGTQSFSSGVVLLTYVPAVAAATTAGSATRGRLAAEPYSQA